MTFLLDLLRKHWPLAVAAAVGAAATWWLKRTPPQPKVHEVETATSQTAVKAAEDTHADVGGWTRTTYDFAPTAAPGTNPVQSGPKPDGFDNGVAPAVPDTGHLLRLTVEQHDPTVIERHAITDEHQETAQRLDLTIAPAAARQFQVGFEDMPGLILRRDLTSLRLASRMRLFSTPWWSELSVQPLYRDDKGAWKPKIGVAAAVEF